MAAGSTYTPLATTTLNTATASVTFSSISSAYTDLVLVISYYGSNAGDTTRIRFNSDTNTNYSKTFMGAYDNPNGGYGSTNFSNYTYLFQDWQVGGGTTTPNTSIFQIMNYSNTTTYKSVLIRANSFQGSNREVSAEVGLWRSTSAINTILIYSSNTSFAANSIFTLYGIKAA